jgi:uncharacterized protein (DUF1778 family)
LFDFSGEHAVQCTETEPNKMTVEANTRIEVRTTKERKQLIKEAADLEGQSLTDFIVSVSLRKAKERLAHYSSMTVSLKDFNQMMDMIDNPPAPNAYLKQSMKKLKSAGMSFELQNRTVR